MEINLMQFLLYNHNKIFYYSLIFFICFCHDGAYDDGDDDVNASC